MGFGDYDDSDGIEIYDVETTEFEGSSDSNQPESEAFYYTVQSGDTLSKIAREQYGNAGQYMKIFNANRDILDDPNKIYPGQMLRIP